MSQTRTVLSVVLRWLPAAVWAGVIFAGSSVPGSQIPGRFSVFGHLFEYAVLGAAVALAMRVRLRPRDMLVALAVCAVYAASDEIHQAFVPLRTPDILDWLTDLAGAAVGITAVALARERARRRASVDA